MRIEKNNFTLESTDEIAGIDPSLFPRVEGFDVRLRNCGMLGLHVDFYNAENATLAGFGWWDHADADIRDMTRASYPCGSVSEPYYGIEQSWELLIWENGDEVFVMEGNEEGTLSFNSWFRVSKSNYVQAWDDLVARVKRSGGAFKSIDAALRSAAPVNALVLNGSQLMELPQEVGKLGDLEYLGLCMNRLQTLPSSIGKLKKMKWLDLRMNNINRLPGEFSALESLEDVNLAGNKLTEIPSYVAGMSRLRAFFIHDNPVNPSSVEDLRRQRPDMEIDYKNKKLN